MRQVVRLSGEAPDGREPVVVGRELGLPVGGVAEVLSQPLVVEAPAALSAHPWLRDHVVRAVNRDGQRRRGDNPEPAFEPEGGEPGRPPLLRQREHGLVHHRDRDL
jgi:hypothetical protein